MAKKNTTEDSPGIDFIFAVKVDTRITVNAPDRESAFEKLKQETLENHIAQHNTTLING